jgi:hypothetical protein
VGLHFVKDLDLLGGEKLSQLLFHLLVECLHLGKIRAQDRFELGTVAFGDLVRFPFLLGGELQGSGRARQEGRWWPVRVRRQVIPT